MQDIKLTITGSQIENDGYENKIEFFTDGRLKHEGGDTVIEYYENEFYGENGTKTSLKISDGSVYMTRSGELTTEVVFSEAKTYEAMYSTPAGAFLVNVFPIKVDSTEDEAGGSLDLEYEIKIGDVRAHNRLNIVYEMNN